MQHIGIDIGKDYIYIAVPKVLDSLNASSYEIKKCPNEIASINAYFENYDTDSVQIIFESTGKYSYRLGYCLDLLELPYTALNPNQSNGFAKSMKIISQNDERDAILLSLYGQKIKPSISTTTNEQLHELRQKRHHLSSLLKQKQVIDNQLHAIEFDPRAASMVKESLLDLRNLLDQQIEKFKSDIFHLDDDEYKKIYDQLIQIPGVGESSASALIIATNGFKDFENPKQVSKFLGIIPSSKDSGSSVRIKGKIIKTGVPYIRGILYMAATSARRFNTTCKELFERLRAKGKPYKVAMMAVVNKIVKQAFAIVKNDTTFDNNFAKAK